jgi:hypothetical protein
MKNGTFLAHNEHQRGNQEWTIRKKTGNIGHTRHKAKTKKLENATQYLFATTLRKQTQINKT